MQRDRIDPSTLLGAVLLVVGSLVGCDLNDTSMEEGALRSRSYALTAQTNDNPIPDGLAGTATFWEMSPRQTLVTLALDDPVSTPIGLVAHIHANSASEGGGIQFFLSPIDLMGRDGTSAKLIDRPYNDLVAFDGHINIYEGNSNALVGQGDIGANADGWTRSGLERVEAPRVTEYKLPANSNQGGISEGVAGTARFIELTPTTTLVQLQLDDGPTGALLAHPAHIHTNSVREGGDIAIYLSPIDGNGNPANDGASSKIIERSYDELVAFDGHIDIHQSHGNIQDVITRGNIGANGEGM